MALNLNQKIELTQLELLNNMYSKHRVNAETLLKKIETLSKLEDIFNHDQDHFLGKSAVEKSILKINIRKEDKVLDLGSGFGGPARYIYFNTDCKVDGVEIQKDRWKLSIDLNKKYKIDNVNFYNDDFTNYTSSTKYNKCVAFLSLLHSIDLNATISNISSLLEPDALFYIEDYLAGENYQENLHSDKLLEFISCPSLIYKNDFQKLLEDNSLEIIEFNDLTEVWKSETIKRYDLYIEHRLSDIKFYGKDLTEASLAFAKTIKDLFIENAILGYSAVIRKV